MLFDFRAISSLQGKRINLNWTWLDPGGRLAFRLVRRQLGYPQTVDDGFTVLDFGDLMRAPAAPWAAVERTRYLVVNSNLEEGLRQAEASFYFTAAADPEPARAVIYLYDPAADSGRTTAIDAVTRVVRTEVAMPPWAAVTTLQIFSTPNAGPEIMAGELIISTGHTDGVTPDHLEWTPEGQPSLGVEFDRIDAQMTTSGDIVTTPTSLRATFQTLRTGAQLRVIALPAAYQTALEEQVAQHPMSAAQAYITLSESFDMDSGDWNRTVTVADLALTPDTAYYYALFVPEATNAGVYRSELDWRAFAVATGDYGLSERLYQLLPALHQEYDEASPELQGEGQLRRYLQIFGAGLDQVRSLAEGLRDRHDVDSVRADLLPSLSRWIGWEPDQTLDAGAQRQDIRFAPEIFSTTGTLPNLRSLVNRATAWDCRIKEFVHNVFLTNAPEHIRLWELWERRHDGTQWADAVPVTRTDGFDGRPVALLDGAATTWLFWHSDRSGRREIWLQRLDGVDADPQRASEGAPDDAPDLRFADESPAAVPVNGQVWLFWSSNRDGNWEIYTRAYAGLPGDAAIRLTEHAADDRFPAAVRGSGDSLWLFWQSNRRGPTDIWARARNGAEWSLPARITSAGFRHEMPAAVVDNTGRLWLFWSADLGDRHNLFVQVRSSSAWSPTETLTDNWNPAQPITSGPQRDEAPAAIFFAGQVWLFWQSDRSGQWQIWGMVHDGAAWGDPFAVIAEVTADKEPAAFVNGAGELRLFWRSQRRGRSYQSRTVDTSDPTMLAELRTFEDHAHYSYHTGFGNEDWYARGAVGVYLAPDTDEEPVITARINRASNFVESFRPVSVRYVWITDESNE